MRLSIAKLRSWIIGVAVLLLAVVGGFLWHAHYKISRAVGDLPAKLDKEVERLSKGFTYSRSANGRTSFTIHASSAVEYKGGSSATLHDVVITLYGAQGDRSDRISGSEFNYDQKAGIVTALGEVQIDLQGAGLSGQTVAPQDGGLKEQGGKGAAALSTQQTVHIKTSGLVFNQQTQVATTAQYVEFSTAKGSGHATGATYDVQKGLLVLNSAVELKSDRDGQPVLIHASHAEFLRNSMQAFLLNPVSDYKSEQSSAAQATVYFRKDGTAEHVDAEGHIHVKTDDGKDMTGGKARIQLDERGEPQRADLSGGLNFISNDAPHQMHGNAIEGTLLFAADGALRHSQARGAVSFVDQQTGLPGDPQGSATRELRGAQVDIDFTSDPGGHAVADKVLVAGGATTVLHTVRTKGASQNTTIQGDQLVASLQNGRAITSLHGAGHTSVLDISPNGASDRSSGDSLQVNFNPPSGGAHAATPARQKPADPAAAIDSSQIQSVVQEGNVVIVQTPGRPTGTTAQTAAPTRITARRADYSSSTQILKLTGSPRIDDGTTDLTADSVDYHRDTSIAEVNGNVKATYEQAPNKPQNKSGATAAAGFGGQGPTHVISSTATLDQAHGLGIFRGQARLWQAANSVAAPVIELSRSPDALKAYGETAGSVTTVIASASDPSRPSTVFRVHSRQLLYSDHDRKALFSGAVVAEDASGVVHCDQAEVFFEAASQSGRAAAPANVGAGPASVGEGRIDRVVATGHVVLQQPGRRGTGERLLYTAQDEKFVLTGTSATPPRLYDRIHGTVTGDALIFDNRDDSVSVTGGQSKAITDTRTAK